VTVQVVSDVATAFATTSNVILVQGAVAGAADTTTVASFLDAYGTSGTQLFSTGDVVLFAVNVSDGNARVYEFVSAGADATISNTELTLVTTLVGVTTDSLTSANFA